MSTWFTSDGHEGHSNILEYAERPFRDVHHMHEELRDRWNEVVAPEDTVYYVGDAAMGSLEEWVPKYAEYHGYKVLILGNHDGPWKGGKPSRIEKYTDLYNQYFDEVIEGPLKMNIGIQHIPVVVCHFPYTEIGRHGDRYNAWRPDDEGLWLIHGHTHVKERIKPKTHEVHVGVDAWDYRPVNEQTIADLIEANS